MNTAHKRWSHVVKAFCKLLGDAIQSNSLTFRLCLLLMAAATVLYLLSKLK